MSIFQDCQYLANIFLLFARFLHFCRITNFRRVLCTVIIHPVSELTAKVAFSPIPVIDGSLRLLYFLHLCIRFRSHPYNTFEHIRPHQLQSHILSLSGIFHRKAVCDGFQASCPFSFIHIRRKQLFTLLSVPV